MPDFWRDSGYHLLEPRADGRLGVTEAYLRAYWNRPEVRPVEESNAAEHALHRALLAEPARPVAEAEIAALEDPDAIEAYRIVLAFRQRLLAAGSVEGAYLDLVLNPPDPAAGEPPVPPLFFDQMAHVVLRAILEGSDQPLRARAAELLFRTQKVTVADGHVMAADAETVEMYATSGGFGSLGELLVEAQTPLRTIELDVLTSENAELYWSRDSRHDTVLNLNFAGDGLDALCRVLEAWVRRFLAVEVALHPVQQIRDERWVWHLGLDAEGNRLLNDLYEGREVGEARLARLLSLFRLEFRNPSEMRADIAGRPVYLAMAMDEAGELRLKPQNLLVNLPLAERA
ncbi:hypothetical protein SAMN06265365_1014 [Tistlia consotensis]|uniref:Uncharacterized protein n=1 Tax=Tistlia consotensis USBA 355 TaxID=560819 RepID=A0A1Y6B6V2_9PROT|nr:DUF6352 family protein [Tistlia consotensis]SME87736.1 hypothetical protein SAMN05428998_1014 [Tistlia consotensis USBA 355]SNR24081.1 hypothetical protein SAMN06265365_1014 [Tistlia consotensis]